MRTSIAGSISLSVSDESLLAARFTLRDSDGLERAFESSVARSLGQSGVSVTALPGITGYNDNEYRPGSSVL